MPQVNPQILQWARETAGLELADAAKKLQLRDSQKLLAFEKLSEYERGAKEPSRRLLLLMSKQYRRPLLTFYLPARPEIADRGEDFRTLSHALDPSENSIVDALVRNIHARQAVLREALLSEGDQEELDFVGSYSLQGGVNDLARQITERAGIDLTLYRGKENQEKAFKYLRGKIENVGIFTLLAGNLGSHHTNISTDVFRGFALADKVAPFIVINDQDAKTAWPVTLLHEVAHIWIGATGISSNSFGQKVEKFCDRVASQILLPEAELESSFDYSSLSNFDNAIVAIDAFAKERKISPRLVAFRLLAISAISSDAYKSINDLFHTRWQEAQAKKKKQNKEADGGPSYYVIKRFRSGDALLNTSERLMRSGELSTSQTAAVLGVRALKVGSMLNDSVFSRALE